VLCPSTPEKEVGHVGLGVSLILIAAGAIMAWAVNVSTTGFNIHTVGYILLLVGIVGALLSLVFWSSWAGPGYFGRHDRVIDDRY
jgi:beta-lactamase regulating signal transducer with metallopeptidase domain